MQRKLIALIAVAISAFLAYSQREGVSFAPSTTPVAVEAADASELLQRAFEERRRNLQVRGSGVVDRILADDNEGSRHQRFLIRTRTGQSILVAHNIDLAPRVEPLKVGDRIEFNGEYEWNERGGVIHWTHHDPKGRHEGGWIRRGGAIFQ
jgi:hypothetical protein